MTHVAAQADDPGKGVSTRIATAALWCAVLTPLVLLPGLFFPFVTARNVFFRLCVEVALSAIVLTRAPFVRSLEGKADPILRWFLIYLAVISVSALFGFSPWHSFFGDFERMGGVWAWLHLILFYFLLRTVLTDGSWRVMLRAIVVVADVVVFWGALEFLPQSFRNPLFETFLSTGSSTGNAGLLGPYLLLSAAVACWLYLEEKRLWWRVLSAFSVAILLFGIAGSRNRSSALGVLFGFLAGVIVYFALNRDKKRLARTLLIAGTGAVILAVAAGYALHTYAPATADHFRARWNGFLTSPVDHSRTIEWKIALEGFRDRPLLGYGPENHEIIASHHFDPEIYSIVGQGLFDRAHNAWLELLGTSGLLGALAMLGVWMGGALTIIKGVREGSLSTGEAAVFTGMQAGYAVYLTFWFFDINSAYVWVSLLGLLVFRVHGAMRIFAAPDAAARPAHSRLLRYAIVALIVAAGYVHGVVPIIAARDLGTAASGGQFDRRLSAFLRVMDSPAPQTEHTLPLYYRFLRSTSSLATSANAPPAFRREFDLALQRGLLESQRAIARDPKDDRPYVDDARLLMLAGLFYGDSRYLYRARGQFVRAMRMSPRRPDTRILFSGLLLTFRDTTEAAHQLALAMKVAPAYGAGFFFAAKLQLARGTADSAAMLLEKAYGDAFPGTQDVLERTVSALQSKHGDAVAARLAQHFLETNYGPYAQWKKGHLLTGGTLSPDAERLACRVPLMYLKAADANAAITAAEAVGAVSAHARNPANKFVKEIGSGMSWKWSAKTSILDP